MNLFCFIFGLKKKKKDKTKRSTSNKNKSLLQIPVSFFISFFPSLQSESVLIYSFGFGPSLNKPISHKQHFINAGVGNYLD